MAMTDDIPVGTAKDLERVNVHPTGPTDPNEMKILEDLYGKMDDDGVFRGEADSE